MRPAGGLVPGKEEPVSEDITELLITKIKLRTDGKGVDFFAKGHRYADTTLFTVAELAEDPVVGARINRLIRYLQQQLAITSVVVTHDIDSAAYVGDRIAWLHRGAVDFVGTMDEARTRGPGPLQDFLQAREA